MIVPVTCPVCLSSDIHQINHDWSELQDTGLHWIYCGPVATNQLWHFSLQIQDNEVFYVTLADEARRLHIASDYRNNLTKISRIMSGWNIELVRQFQPCTRFDYTDPTLVQNRMMMLATYL